MTSAQQAEFARMRQYYQSQGERYSFAELWPRVSKARLELLDAFDGGASPTHLLTREAFEIYRAQLAPGGVIAVHISNRYVRLEPVMRGLAEALGLDLLIRTDDPVGVPAATASRWALLGDDLSALARATEGLLQPSAITESVLWTDDRQDLWGILRLGR